MFEGNYKDDPFFLKEICLILQYSYLILFTETQFSSHNLELSNLKQKKNILTNVKLLSSQIKSSFKIHKAFYKLVLTVK